ncbi:MAG: dockerin type I repeat-containing protein [Ruminococcus sp.]|nr:dockerin type I repeat-containing protein [Ruminococcus sp.]
MKKLVALLLSLILLLGCGVVAVSAEGSDTTQDYESKLSPALIKEINRPGDEMIDVYIFLKDCPAKWHVDEIVSQKYTWTDEREHLMYYRREMAATIGPYVQQFVDDNADLLYAIICQIDSAEFIIATVAKENVSKLAQQEIVQDMDTYGAYSEPTIDVPDIAGMITEAANALYYNPRYPITARDITVRDYYPFRDSSAYAVYFTVRNMEYTCDIIEERIGGWLLVSARPEPYLFVDNKLYGFKEAYDAGVMTDEMIEELSESAFLNDKSPLLTRFIKGDADGDGAVSIIDATKIQRYEANITATGTFYKPLADVDGDSDVSVIDATLIQRSEAGLYTIG